MKHLHLELQGSLTSNMVSGFFFGESAKVGGRRKGEKRTASFSPRVPNKMEVSGVPNCTSHTTVLSMGYCQVNQIIVLANLANYNKRKQLNEPIKIGNVDTVLVK